MKKSTKIIITVVVVWIVLSMLAVGALLILGIKVATEEKTPITTVEFIDKAREKGLVPADASNQAVQYDYVKKAYIAVEENNKYQIEFYELSDEEMAKAFFNNNVEVIKTKEGSVTARNEINISNYSKYTSSSTGKCMVVSRIGNTVIYLNVADEYKDTVKNILEELGY